MMGSFLHFCPVGGSTGGWMILQGLTPTFGGWQVGNQSAGLLTSETCSLPQALPSSRRQPSLSHIGNSGFKCSKRGQDSVLQVLFKSLFVASLAKASHMTKFRIILGRLHMKKGAFWHLFGLIICHMQN